MVEVGILLLRLILCLVFTVAGVSKLLAPRSTRQMLQEFGVPRPLAPPLGWLLTLAELSAALLTAMDGFVGWGALFAAVLLSVFTVAMGVNLLQGRNPRCRCFGEWSVKPISSKTILRNIVLLSIASLFLALGDDTPRWSSLTLSADAPERITRTVGVLAVLFVLLALLVLGWLVLHLLRQNGRLLQRIEVLEAHLGIQAAPSAAPGPTSGGLPVGAEAPNLALTDRHGSKRWLLEPLSAGKPLMVFFVSPRCAACRNLMPDIIRWEEDPAIPFEIVVVSSGSADDNMERFGKTLPANFFLQDEYEAEKAYRATFTPSALLVGTDGRIATPLHVGSDAIRRFVAGLPADGSGEIRRQDAAPTEDHGNGSMEGSR